MNNVNTCHKRMLSLFRIYKYTFSFLSYIFAYSRYTGRKRGGIGNCGATEIYIYTYKCIIF